MSVLDKFLEAIKLNDDYEDDEFLDDDLLDEDDEFLDDDLDRQPKKKFLDRFGKKKSEEDDFDDFTLEQESAASRSTLKTATIKASVKPDKERAVRSSSKITPMRSSKKNTGAAATMEVCVIKPTSMEDTREIADTLVDNSTVILNLEGIDVELAQRIIDFTSGACYSLGGSLQKVSSYIFVLGPYNVDITGDLQNILGGSVPSVRAGY